MTYEKKNGEFACFKKQSKKGTPYFNGTLTLDGKEYWVSIFNKHSQKGEQYLSGVVEPKKQKEELGTWEEETKEEPINDGIPF